MSDTVQGKDRIDARVGLQRSGRFISGMVMPNIGAFIAWGLITALFIPTGWLPNANFAKLVGPMITFLLPLLIAYTAGKMIYDTRGGIIGAIAVTGIIVGSSIPMFLGAMIVGPLAALGMKKIDTLYEGKLPAGFEMLVSNFSMGIVGTIFALVAYVVVAPAVMAISSFLAAGVQAIVSWNLLPLANLFIEPGKVLFLNNAINHGVLGPIGVQQSAGAGKSIIFMLESNPGPGLGILLAYSLAGNGVAKQSAPSAIIIHFLGGIHEIYFPYILMNPKLILAAIAGGMTGTFVFSILGAGLVATPSPGSIFAYLAMTPKGGLFPMLAGVTLSAAASFVVAWLLLKLGKQNVEADGLEKAAEKTAELKGSKLKVDVMQSRSIRKIVFACDAGMGSSAMGASIMRTKVKKAGLDIIVANSSIGEIPGDADVVITHETLTDRARQAAPKARHISITDFIKSPEYDKLVTSLTA
ncbi:MAG: PTS mannitol transporter subunit IIBC [Spirochaetae bacterium HGW-Spirochaetae-7]|jgi:PTS system mannitol-specific IIC component|nr:MAG: PTS mannitol transporter subunit IIBC [Spirochaetae bacterium HGW-Spirochaetae-7]